VADLGSADLDLRARISVGVRGHDDRLRLRRSVECDDVDDVPKNYEDDPYAPPTLWSSREESPHWQKATGLHLRISVRRSFPIVRDGRRGG
jgi:hypothetical protein